MRRVVAMALVGVALVGCAPTAPYRRPAIDVPAAWNIPAATGAGTALERRWWLRFGDDALTSLSPRPLRAS